MCRAYARPWECSSDKVLLSKPGEGQRRPLTDQILQVMVSATEESQGTGCRMKASFFLMALTILTMHLHVHFCITLHYLLVVSPATL